MPPPIRIRVTASVDANLGLVFVPLKKGAREARETVAKESKQGASESAAAYEKAANEERQQLARTWRDRQRYAADQARLAKQAAAEVERIAKQDERLAKQVADTKVRESERAANEERKQLAQSWRDRQKYAADQQRMAAREQREADKPGFWTKKRHLGMIAGTAGRIGMGALDAGVQLAGDVVRGLGVHTDLSEMFTEGTKNEALFRDISSFGYMPNTKSKNNVRVDPARLLKEAHTIGQQTGFSAGEVGEGLEKFVGLTGDLNLGREALKDMAVLSKATGSSLGEMVEAAGAASNTLGDVPDKAKVLYEVMKQVSSEGKTGAILIKDMAVQMAKIASSAQMFSGNRAETISTLGALAQEARGRGGAASASQAATSVQQFTNVFRKRQRLDTFTGFGIKAFDENGGIRDPQKLITESFEAAIKGGYRLTPGGKHLAMQGAAGVKDQSKGWQNFETNLTAMYGDVKAMRATAGFESVFKEAYTGTKGSDSEKLAAATAAVNAEFRRLKVDMMDEATVQEDFALAMKNSKSQVSILNDSLQQTAEGFEKELYPAIMKLAPDIEILAKGAATAAEVLLGLKPKTPAQKDATNQNFDVANANTAEGKERFEHGEKVEGAAAQALELANVRAADGSSGQEAPRLPGLIGPMPASPKGGGVVVPKETQGVLDEHAAQLAAQVAIARGRLAKARQNVAGPGKTDEEVETIDEQRVKFLSGYASGGIHGAYESAKSELSDAEKQEALAKSMANAMKEALQSGRIQVVVVEDKTARPNAPPPFSTGKDTIPPEGPQR